VKQLSILEVYDDEVLTGGQFRAESWRPWRSVLALIFHCACTEAEASMARGLSNRQDVLERAYREVWLTIGRRAGKSKILAFIAFYLACFMDWRSKLSSGEVGVIMILAADRDQAQVILSYVKGFIHGCPLTAQLVTNEGVEHVMLGTRKVSIEVHTSNHRSPRGRTVIAALLDEVAFWRSETSANPAEETVRAIRPSLLSLSPHSMLIGASSPHIKSGLLWDQFRQHFGREGDRVLVLQAPSLTMNPALDAAEIYASYESDPEAAGSEYGAEWRSDLAAYVTAELVDAAVVPGRIELPKLPGIAYHGFLDPASGVGAGDSMTLGICHREGLKVVVDALHEARPPFSPETVAYAFAKVALSYGLRRLTSDRVALGWVGEAFARHGVTIDASALPKAALYGTLLAALSSYRVELPDHARLRTQLLSLERRVRRGGGESIDHPQGGAWRDDVANAAAGAACLALGKPVAGPIDFYKQTIINHPTPAAWRDAIYDRKMEDISW
jgi:hypothetical protein